MMTHRSHVSLCGIVVGLTLHASASFAGQGTEIQRPANSSSTAKAWVPILAPDGHPDLQGVWSNNSATPLERPAVLAGRTLLTDEEVATLKSRAARLFNGPGSDFPVGDAAFLAALANVEHVQNPISPDNPNLQEIRDFDRRTSLIVTPTDGRIPYTLEG